MTTPPSAIENPAGRPTETSRGEHTDDARARRRALETVAAKRDGRPAHPDAIGDLIDAYMSGAVEDPLMTAFLMASVIRGLEPAETRELCDAMVRSGSRLDFSEIGRPVVDKHSTGGVGDKTSLLLAPMLAAVGAVVPMMSGRGLGHTGGTLDKLEAIPGFTVDLTIDRLRTQLRDVGAAICAANHDLAPADARLYALRDQTATVPGLGLIAASIMSKKIAEGTNALVLDVKHGPGAFLPDPAEAEALAHVMVELGVSAGVNTRALLTDMTNPLGNRIGNALEIREILDALEGRGPADLLELSIALARDMAEMCRIERDPAETLRSGEARERWDAMVRSQGGDPTSKLPTATHQHQVCARRDGYVNGIDARTIGETVGRLGGGRTRAGEPIDHTVGVELKAKPGARVHSGEVLAVVHASSAAAGRDAVEAVRNAYTFADTPPRLQPLISKRIG